MKIFLRRLSIAGFIGAVIALPLLASAAGLVPCGGTFPDGTAEPACDFNYLITMVNRVVTFLLYGFAVPVAALGFLFAGGKLIIAQNKESAWTEAKEIFGNILLGFGIFIAAFILVKAFLVAFVKPGADNMVNFLLGF